MILIPEFIVTYLFILNFSKNIIINKINYKYVLYFLIVLSVLYLITYFDNSEKTGKRKLKFFDDFFLFKMVRKFFNIKYSGNVKELQRVLKNKEQGAIIAGHPHGILSMGSCYGFKNSKMFEQKDLYCAMFPFIFKLPVVRDLCLAVGGIDCRKNIIEDFLNRNKKVGIAPGGSRGISCSNRYYLDMILKNEGFIKLCWEHNSVLIPLFIEGENRIFQQISFISIQNFFYKLIRYHFPVIFYGPLSTNLTLHIGKPLYPKNFDNYEDFRKKYWKRLFTIIHKNEKGPIKGELLKKMREYGFKINNKKREKYVLL